MRILMFGWEFPPYVSGGLGTACYGMTEALSAMGHEILFVMPALDHDDRASHVQLLSASDILRPLSPPPAEDTGLARVLIRPVLSPLRPYLNALAYRDLLGDRGDSYLALSGCYGEDLLAEVCRYGTAGSLLAETERFDMIHGHDWMSVPACLAAREKSDKPFILHIHALEYDRSGEHINPDIYEIEQRGMAAADAVIAVSHYTKGIIRDRYGIPGDKVTVVHNAVTQREGTQAYHATRSPFEKVVLFLGRITFQKGPDYFVEAARKVLKEMPEVTFVMAGAGDMMPRMIERVAELGMGKCFHFTGFLRDGEVERIFARSDLYVMPSVSEPFGISPLEAMMYDVPVIISRQSGVAEVLHHALKVDFWDVEDMAQKMIAVLKYPPLAGELAEKAREELRTIRWEKAAAKMDALYRVLAAGERA